MAEDLPPGWAVVEMIVIDGAVHLVAERLADGYTITADGRADVPFDEVLQTIIEEIGNALPLEDVNG
jgi:hypothetical protein